jgi:hypothetical protein
MRAGELIKRLERVQGKPGGGWRARCPAHEDRTPSLEIGERDGKILLWCGAGCSVESICASIGIKVRDLHYDVAGSTPVNPTAKHNAGKNGAKENGSAPRFVKAYDYCDEACKLLFQTVRYEPKGFRQRRPDGKGGWTWSLGNVRRVLYNLPEVLKAQSVMIPEGEKDCNTARKLGFVATTNPMGAGKWRDEYSEALRGKDCVIFPDQDENGKGQEHGLEVAASLHLRARSVKIVNLPCKDLSVWVESGFSLEALNKLIEQAPIWTPDGNGKAANAPASSQSSGFVLQHVGELLAKPEVPTDYIVDGLLVAGTASLDAAKPKAGKSTFARNLGVTVAHGEPFLGRPTKQGEVIYLALEEREQDVTNDFRAMGCTSDTPIHVHAAPMPKDGVAALCDLIRQRKPALVVGDPLIRLIRVKDEKAYAEMYNAMGVIIDVCRETNTHIHLVHHGGKAEKADAIDNPLGSTALGGAPTTIIVLKRKPDGTRTIGTVQRIGTDIPETILQMDADTKLLSLGQERAAAEVETLSKDILDYLRGEEGAKTEPEILDAVEGKTGRKRQALRQLFKEGQVSRAGTGKKGDSYKYSFPRSHIYPGTRERESEKGPDTRINTDGMPVPNSSEKNGAREQANWAREQANVFLDGDGEGKQETAQPDIFDGPEVDGEQAKPGALEV